MKTDDTQLLRLAEAAECMNISASTVRRLVRAGRLRSVLIGRERRVPLCAVLAFVAG